MTTNDDNQTDSVPDISIETIYKECAESYRYHIDWRYRMLTRYIVAISALITVTGFLFTHEQECLHRYAFLPCGAIFVVSALFIIVTRRNKLIFDHHEKLAASLEQKYAKRDGIYSRLETLPTLWPPSYNVLLPIVYAIIGLFALLISHYLYCNAL